MGKKGNTHKNSNRPRPQNNVRAGADAIKAQVMEEKKATTNVVKDVTKIESTAEVKSLDKKATEVKTAKEKSIKKTGKSENKFVNFLKSNIFAAVLTGVYAVLTIVLLGLILYINVLPVKFFIPICFVMFALCGITFLTAFSKKAIWFARIFSVIMTVVCGFGIYYAVHANYAYEDATGAKTKTDVVNVYVMKADPADDLTSAADYTFGILTVLDRENTDKTINEIEKKLGKKIKTESFEGYIQLVEALYEGDVDAVILNTAYIPSIEENEQYKSFTSLTKILLKSTHETEITVDNTIQIDKSPFIVYLSGIDIEGDVSTTSRSDVNILAVVNPETRQVLLLNTPRDYYVPLSISNGKKDKLTHAGIYGIDVSMNTLGMLYQVRVDYFFRINFTGFIDIVDALDGINVYSAYDFKSTHWDYPYKKGYNQLNGEEALAFVRERYAFRDGDNQRGKNQIEAIKAIANEMMSPAILNNFSGLMESISSSFQTSMSSSQISSLVRMQLAEGGSWEIYNFSVAGDDAKKPVYSLSQEVYVTIPYEDDVENAKTLINMVLNGQLLSKDIIDEMNGVVPEDEKNNETDDDEKSDNAA